MRGIYFTNTKSAASYFDEVSNGRISVSGDVFGWFTLPFSTATCDYSAWATAARNAAAASGVSIGSYTNYVYAFPKVDACPWGGLGSVNGPHSWINGKVKMNLYVTTHELGHNFGSHHASTLRCTQGGVRVPLSSSCTVDEYGDPFDIMGGTGSYSFTYHVNSFARRQIGALTTADQQTVTVNGIYTVAAAQLAGGSPRVLRVLRPKGDYFYLEYRRPYGLFDTWATSSPVVNGVSIRIAPNTQRTQSQLIDTVPETTTFNDAPLAAGRTFTDPTNGISITTLAVGSDSARVRVQVGPDLVAPSTPAGLTAEAAGASAIRLSWSPATDDLEVAGYRVRRGEQDLGTVTGLSFDDTGLAQAATYSYSVTALDSSGNASLPASTTHFLPDTTPPSAAGSFAASQSGPRAVSLRWAAATDNIAVTGYRVLRNGKLLATVTTLGYEDASVVDGYAYDYAVRAVDEAGNVGPTLSAGVALPDVTAPSAPGALAGLISGTTARIDWGAATDNVAVVGYVVSRHGAADVVLPATARSYSEAGLPDGSYSFQVRAFDAAGNHGATLVTQLRISSVDTTAPSVPGGLKAKSMARRYIQLSWQPSTDDRAGTIRYALFRGTTRIARITGTTFTDRPAAVGSYKYKVRAIDAAGNKSAFSPVITAKAVRAV
ncbi:MAG TPA: hypothetical protein VM307_09315 [Egibacteraceae bacterium]|nr:hypothetical protein [Egibacteraceae bacterium]